MRTEERGIARGLAVFRTVAHRSATASAFDHGRPGALPELGRTAPLEGIGGDPPVFLYDGADEASANNLLVLT